MGARNWVGIGLSYKPARLHRMAASLESIPGLLTSLKIPSLRPNPKKNMVYASVWSWLEPHLMSTPESTSTHVPWATVCQSWPYTYASVDCITQSGFFFFFFFLKVLWPNATLFAFIFIYTVDTFIHHSFIHKHSLRPISFCPLVRSCFVSMVLV